MRSTGKTYHVTCDAWGREVVGKREAEGDGVPPGRLRLVSPYDRDARWSAKGDELFWLGYKVHLTETCDTGTDGTRGGGPAAAGAPKLLPLEGAMRTGTAARCRGGPTGVATPRRGDEDPGDRARVR
ncbi:hypothetical protein ACWEQL_03730 [Kitasatospora sp. NPDC004240]